jgi:hypothetical protein
MKNKIANIAKAIRNSRKTKVFAIIAVVWVALLVGFVVASWTAAKPKPVVIVNPQSSTVRPLPSAHKHHPRAATKRMPENASASNPATPCLPLPVTSNQQPSSSLVTPAQDQARNDQIHHTVPVDSSEHQDRQYQDRSRTATPIAPYPETSRVPSVVWVSAVASPYPSSVQRRVVPVQAANISVSLATQRKSEPGFRSFQRQVETGKQTSRAGFQPFRP